MIPDLLIDDKTNKITNINDIVDFIMYKSNKIILTNYINTLMSQKNVDKVDLEVLFNTTNNMLSFYDEYDKKKDNFIELDSFFKKYKELIKLCSKRIYDKDLSSSIKEIIITLFNRMITKEEDGIQNDYDLQKIFDDIKKEYIYYDIEDSFRIKLSDIFNKKDSLINKVDNSDDYKDYSNTMILSLNNSINGHNLTDENINVKGYIFTSIILEGSLAIGLIILLISLFK